MKTQYKITLILIILVVVFYCFLPNKAKPFSIDSYPEQTPVFVDLRIYQEESYCQHYDFKLVSDTIEKLLHRKFDSIKNSYYLTTYEIIPGIYELQIISIFDSIIKMNIDIRKDTSFQLDSNWIKKYEKNDEYYNYFKNRITGNLCFDLVFESRGCFTGSSIRYVFNSNPDNLSMIYQIKNGAVTDSMQVDKNKLNKKLTNILHYNKHPEKPETYVNEKGETFITISAGWSTSSTTLYFNYEEKLYHIWSNDLSGKRYNYFLKFCKSFQKPIMVMKI